MSNFRINTGDWVIVRDGRKVSNPRWRSRTVNRFNVTSAMSAQTVVGIAALILLMVDELALSADGR